MANQLKMAEVQAILALARSGCSNRRIARQLGVHRETVARHIRLSGQDSKPASTPLGSEGAPHGSSTAPIGSVSTASPWREVIVRKLDLGLTARRIYQDLCADHSYSGSYYSVRRLVKKLAAATRTRRSSPTHKLKIAFPWAAIPPSAGKFPSFSRQNM
jgi:IS30 family transposase